MSVEKEQKDLQSYVPKKREISLSLCHAGAFL